MSEKQQRNSHRAAAEWCPLAERRLLKKILTYKPAGVSKRFQMTCLTDRMNHVYDDEDTDFEELLDKDDAAVARDNHQKRIDADSIDPNRHHVVSRGFQPIYKIRPNPAEIWKKLATLYDLELVEDNEYFPEDFARQSEFFLPDGEFSELIREKEEETHKARSRPSSPPPVPAQLQPPPPPSTSSAIQPPPPPAPSSTASRSGARRRKRRDSGETHSSSRSSTPSVARDLRRS